jgi:hypothetical protein
VDAALDPVARRAGLGIDTGVVGEHALRYAECRVFWYDVRNGHKTLLGDAGFVPSLDRFRVERIVPSDVRDLLVNRGTLLVINDALLEDPDQTDEARRAIVRHAMKAIIGYGDALLFFLGGYHWSYVERQRRMRGRSEVASGVRLLYDQAMEFRFRPDHGAWTRRDLRAWTEQVRDALRGVHLDVESRRLGRPDLDWPEYADLALGASLVEGAARPRSAARKLLALLRSEPYPVDGPFAATIGWRVASPRERLAAVFPQVAYGVGDPRYAALAAAALGAASTDPAGMRSAYLSSWGRHADPNFAAAARRLGLNLAPAAG